MEITGGVAYLASVLVGDADSSSPCPCTRLVCFDPYAVLYVSIGLEVSLILGVGLAVIAPTYFRPIAHPVMTDKDHDRNNVQLIKADELQTKDGQTDGSVPPSPPSHFLFPSLWSLARLPYPTLNP